MMSEIGTDSYIVAGAEDHIVPWRVSYRTTQLFKGAIRFVMTSGGHIAGIVSPPGPKVRLWTNDALPARPRRVARRCGRTPRHVVERLGRMAGRAGWRAHDGADADGEVRRTRRSEMLPAATCVPDGTRGQDAGEFAWT